MGEYGGHVPKRIQTESVVTPLINGHILGCNPGVRNSNYHRCPGCLKTRLIFEKLIKEPK